MEKLFSFLSIDYLIKKNPYIKSNKMSSNQKSKLYNLYATNGGENT